MIDDIKIKDVLQNIMQKDSFVENLIVNCGRINQEIVISTIKLLEKKLILEEYDKNSITKVKMICIEMMQNLTKHQEINEEIAPYFIAHEDKTGINLCTGNVITIKSKVFLEENLSQYKHFNKEELKNEYLEKFKSASLSKEGNAGLGLLTIFIKSHQKAKYKLIKLTNELYHFNFEVYLNKNQSV